MRCYKLDERGEPVRCQSVLEWASWKAENEGACRVGINELGGVTVSTVFLGMDHSPLSYTPGLPVLWETMVFGGEHDGYQERYTSREEAVKGHAVALQMVINSLNSSPPG